MLFILFTIIELYHERAYSALVCMVLFACEGKLLMEDTPFTDACAYPWNMNHFLFREEE